MYYAFEWGPYGIGAWWEDNTPMGRLYAFDTPSARDAWIDDDPYTDGMPCRTWEYSAFARRVLIDTARNADDRYFCSVFGPDAYYERAWHIKHATMKQLYKLYEMEN